MVASSRARVIAALRPGFVLWFTGLSGAGKTTLAHSVGSVIGPDAPIEILDGDEVRKYLSAGLGFSKVDRDANVRRIGFVATLLARNGIIAIAAAISPYADARDEVRGLAEIQCVPFIEVYVKAELSTLTARDPKGLYRRALDGEIKNFTGISDPYEAPAAPEITLCTDNCAIGGCTDLVLQFLRRRNLISG